MTPPDEHLTPDEIAELGTLLVAERPQPTDRFAAELDARVERRFAPDPAAAAPRRRRAWGNLLHRPFLPAAAATLAVALAALVIVLGSGDGTQLDGGGQSSGSSGGAVQAPASGAAEPAPQRDSAGDAAALDSDRPTFREYSRRADRAGGVVQGLAPGTAGGLANGTRK